MEANWRPVQGSNPPAGGDPNAPATAQLDPEWRSRIVNLIMETLKKHLPVSEPEGLNELQRVAVLFEEEIYSVAIDQNDYLRKLSLKMLSMKTNTQQAPGNAQVIPNQNNPGQASADNTAQTGHTGVGDWQEETYQMIKSLKDQHFAKLNELFNKISVKLQHVDSIIPPQEPSEYYERMKSFKIMLDRVLQVLQISKSTIQPAMREKVPQYEKQIISILNSQKRKPAQPQVHQQFLQVQMNPYKASVDSTAQIGHAGAGDWQEEIYQMIKSLKGKYFAELSELLNKITVKLHHVDSIIPPQGPSEHYERMKSFKIMLDRVLQVLQISKSTIQPALRDKVPRYEKQIISILNSQRRKPVQPQVQQQQFQPPAAGQTPNSNISKQRQPSQSWQQRYSRTNPQASLSSMSTRLQFSSAARVQHPTTNLSVPTHQNGAKRQRQAGSDLKAARRSSFDSVRYGSIFDEWRRITGGEHWADAGYSTADFWYSNLSVPTHQNGAKRQRQAGSDLKGARRSSFDSVWYGSIFDEWRRITGGEHWADAGYSTAADFW